jgi:hypothetical protein
VVGIAAVVGAIWYGLLRWFLWYYLPRQEERDQRLRDRFPDRTIPNATTRWLRCWGGGFAALLVLLWLCLIPLFLFGYRLPPPPREFGFSAYP